MVGVRVRVREKNIARITGIGNASKTRETHRMNRAWRLRTFGPVSYDYVSVTLRVGARVSVRVRVRSRSYLHFDEKRQRR